jgi:predicted transposase YbfD/YdcC
MSACTSCLTRSACRCRDRVQVEPGEFHSLADVLELVEDGRHARGRRHPLVTVLLIAVMATLSGARSYVAMWQWAADLAWPVRAQLGLLGRVPSESTIRRTLQKLDAELLDAVMAAWLAAHGAPGDPDGPPAVAVDGKTSRGARRPDGSRVHLMAAVDHTGSVVLAQTAMPDKGSEVREFTTLLDRIDITGVIVTADALHTQRAHVDYLHRRHAHWVFTVKGNQPTLLTQLRNLPWQDIPAVHVTVGKAHGRVEHRQVKLTAVTAGIGFPRARLAAQITRTRRRTGTTGKPGREVAYIITDLDYRNVTAAQLADLVRGHWTIENRLHWVRDVTLGEDLSQIRTGSGPQVMAGLRNLAVSRHRQAGARNIAAACRAVLHQPLRLLALTR